MPVEIKPIEIHLKHDPTRIRRMFNLVRADHRLHNLTSIIFASYQRELGLLSLNSLMSTYTYINTKRQ